MQGVKGVVDCPTQLGWLDIGQIVAKASILTALKVLNGGSMTNLLEKIAKVDKKGTVRIKQVTEDELRRMNPWGKKSWSTRVRRWLKMMPIDLVQSSPWEKTTRRRVKEWVKDNVSRRGDDGILWRRWNV